MAEAEYTQHPSYGQVSIARRFGSAHLFQSNVEHPQWIVLTIEQASLKRDLHRDWVFGERKLIEVEMSETQFAQLLVSPNTMGVPCTIKAFNGKQVAPFEHAQTERQQIDKEIAARLEGLVQTVATAVATARELQSKTRITKEDIKGVTRSLDGILTEIQSNLPFVAASFQEALDKITNEAKAEFEAYIANSLHQKGLDASQVPVPRLIGANDDVPVTDVQVLPAEPEG